MRAKLSRRAALSVNRSPQITRHFKSRNTLPHESSQMKEGGALGIHHAHIGGFSLLVVPVPIITKVSASLRSSNGCRFLAYPPWSHRRGVSQSTHSRARAYQALLRPARRRQPEYLQLLRFPWAARARPLFIASTTRAEKTTTTTTTSTKPKATSALANTHRNKKINSDSSCSQASSLCRSHTDVPIKQLASSPALRFGRTPQNQVDLG